MTDRFRHIGDHEIYEGHVWTAVVGTFEGPDGEHFTREIVRSPGAVAAVPIVYADDDVEQERPLVVLIAQYRPAFDATVIELPAGMRDVAGERDEDNARRELIEEVGVAPGRVELLTTVFPSSGMTDATVAIYLATDCVRVGRRPHGPEETHAEVLTVALDEALEWVESGRIRNSTTCVGLLLADRRARAGRLG